MEVAIDASDNHSSVQTFPGDFSMFYHEVRRQQQQQQQQQQHDHEQNNANFMLSQHEMMKMADKSFEKKIVTFPFGKCRICQDNATGVHYGVITCEGCKGFFKRSITQGVPYRCFFGDKCIINIETRNRCKACRFKRCLEQGMGMESVKMGRIPKKIKEKALRDYQRQQEKYFQYDQQPLEDNQDSRFNYDDDFETGISHLTYEKRDSFSTVPSLSSSTMSNMNTRQSTDSNQENIMVPEQIVNDIEQEEFVTDDLTEATIPLSDIHSNNPNSKLSSLRLPAIFYESHPTSDTHSNTLAESSLTLNRHNTNDHSLRNIKQTNDINTVSTYISKLNQNTIVGSMSSCEIRYSKNIIPLMKHLSSKLCQPFLIYELDFEVSAFFRYIRWKMWNLYLQHTQRIQMLVQRMLGIINLGITDYPGVNATIEQIWEGIQATIPADINTLIAYAQEMPGINELNATDLAHILDSKTFDFWTIIHYPLFYKNESYIMTVNGLQYTRRLMTQLIGKKTTDALHEFCAALHALNITQVEHSLIIPIILCLPDKHSADSQKLHTLKYCYMYALYIQLCTTRTESEAKIVFENILQLTNLVADLSALCKENIGRIRLGK